MRRYVNASACMNVHRNGDVVELVVAGRCDATSVPRILDQRASGILASEVEILEIAIDDGLLDSPPWDGELTDEEWGTAKELVAEQIIEAVTR